MSTSAANGETEAVVTMPDAVSGAKPRTSMPAALAVLPVCVAFVARNGTVLEANGAWQGMAARHGGTEMAVPIDARQRSCFPSLHRASLSLCLRRNDRPKILVGKPRVELIEGDVLGAGATVSRKSVADLIVRTAEDPSLGLRERLGVHAG